MSTMLVPAADRQSDLFSDQQSAPRWQPGWTPDPDEIRAKMEAMIAQLSEANDMPWTEDRLAHRRTVFPQMSGWLSEDEARALCERFDAELVRLGAVS